jgi:hypothetical protein
MINLFDCENELPRNRADEVSTAYPSVSFRGVHPTRNPLNRIIAIDKGSLGCTRDDTAAELRGIYPERTIKDAVGWGIILWLIGYALGFILFFIVPPSVIGWIIMPIGAIVTLWVLIKKIKTDVFKHFILLAVVWTLIAIVFDYFFLVKGLKPADGYYKLDVYLYYALTFVLPLAVGWSKKIKKTDNTEI